MERHRDNVGLRLVILLNFIISFWPLLLLSKMVEPKELIPLYCSFIVLSIAGLEVCSRIDTVLTFLSLFKLFSLFSICSFPYIGR